MGLSTASVRHPHVMVMAPALTKTSQSHQNFNLPLHSPTTQSTTPTNRDDFSVFQSFEKDCNSKSTEFNAIENLNTLALVSELLKNNCTLPTIAEGSVDQNHSGAIMNSSPPHMGDQSDKMGLQKDGLEVSMLLKERSINNDMDQLFNNLPTGTDIGQNVDELIQVFKSMESDKFEDKLVSTGSDLGPESDSMFQLSSTDLTSNLSPFEKELLNDVDVMNITMEEQFLDSSKENHSKDLIKELEEKQAKLQRKLEFSLRRLRKIQAKLMGLHVSEEIAGIFEHVHRTLRRVKDNSISGDFNHLSSITSEKLKPISQSSAKNLVRKLEMSASMQANAAGKRQSARYFGSGSVETSSLRSALMGATTIPQWTQECKSELQRVVGSLHAETRLLQEEIDSEATLSSSGGESCDEMQAYNNPHQQYLSIQKRAAWRYATERAAIASRWAWLQAQIPDLEYRIRQYSDLHKQIRLNKGAVKLAGSSPPRSEPTSPNAVNGYRGQLPGASPLSLKNLESTANNGTMPQTEYSCSRTRPLLHFRKRKLLQSWGLHAVSKKAARSSTIRCGCVPPTFQCAVCTGRTDPTRPRDLADYLSNSEHIALLDPTFHPVFSLPEDVSTSTHLEAIMKNSEWQHRSTRPSIKTVKFITKSEHLDKNNVGVELQPKKQLTDHRKKYSRLLKSSTISALTAKLKHKFRGRKPALHTLARLRRKRHAEKLALRLQSSLETSNEELDQCGLSNSSIKNESRSSSPLLPMQSITGYNKRSSRISSYDIDNIVIPYSVAASTRVEKLQYKEILTPKWRIVDPEFAVKYAIKNNGSVRDTENPDSDVEDVSEEAVIIRHDKCEQDERKRFLNYIKFPLGYGRARSHKRTDSRAESSGGNSPDRMSPQPIDSIENMTSPIASPPPTPLSMITEEPLPSLSILRRRTLSQSLRGKDKEVVKEEVGSVIQEAIEVIPYDRRTFPLNEDTYDKMLRLMPENHQLQTNIRSQDCISPVSYLDEQRNSPHDSESTESAIGDEDPNDPEWLDIESIKDRYRR